MDSSVKTFIYYITGLDATLYIEQEVLLPILNGRK
jgi:hypothetical protein